VSARRALVVTALLALGAAGCGMDGCELPGSGDDSKRSTVAGVVRVAGSDSALAGVRVTGAFAEQEDVTDAAGHYTLHFEWPERTIVAVALRFAKTGFVTMDTTVNVASGVTRGVNVQMTRVEAGAAIR
jgi:hypothetical protein